MKEQENEIKQYGLGEHMRNSRQKSISKHSKLKQLQVDKHKQFKMKKKKLKQVKESRRINRHKH